MNSKLTPLKTIITGKTLRIIHPISKLLFIEMEHLTILLAFLMTIGTQVSAADPAHLQQLKNTGKCATCDLGGADLSGTDLGGTNLSGAKLISTNLRGANLRGAKLISANLRGADLGGTNLRDADLSGADLGGTNLSGAYMQGAALCNTIMPDGSVIYSGC